MKYTISRLASTNQPFSMDGRKPRYQKGKRELPTPQLPPDVAGKGRLRPQITRDFVPIG